jgi:endonuclease YncB( thermonuclease family)
MSSVWVRRCLAVLLLLLGVSAAFAGDSFYGKVNEVKSADVVVIDNGSAKFVVRIVGIDVPREGPVAAEAKKMVSRMVLGKAARLRLEFRTESGEMVGQLLTAEPESGFRDVGVELVRSGLAQRQKEYDYKYHELSNAQREAQRAQRGLWANTQPQ